MMKMDVVVASASFFGGYFCTEFFVPCFHVPRSRNLPTATSKRGETDDGNRPIYLLARPTSTGNVDVALDREKLAADGIRQISQPICSRSGRQARSIAKAMNGGTNLRDQRRKTGTNMLIPFMCYLFPTRHLDFILLPLDSTSDFPTCRRPYSK